MGRLIVIDGLDGSGKSTQSERVLEELKKKGEKVMMISFPDYKEPSSALVKMYLGGEFSSSPEGVNAYAAGTFYAVDRYASYKKFWEDKYLEGYTILATRYVSSNAIHQMVKLPESEWDNYLDWLDDFEYSKLGLPKPDKVIFLNMSRRVADKLIESRYGYDESKKDIHESDVTYLDNCRKAAVFTADFSGWTVVPCAENGQARTINDISDDVLNEVLAVLGEN